MPPGERHGPGARDPVHSHDHAGAAGHAASSSGHHHDHAHGHRPHRDGRPAAAWHRLTDLLHLGHGEHDSVAVDAALEASDDGMRALLVSLAGLGVTAAAQGAVVAVTGSVALLGDSLHNVADALTAVPLGLAFWLGRRPPTRRYTHGFGRAEDLAGVAIVVVVAASAAAAAVASVRGLASAPHVHRLWAVALGAVIGFVGNELVAAYRIRVGRRIGSAALVADGLHARTDALTSLAVLVGVAGVAAGLHRADPVVGLVITLVILVVLRTAARDVYRRLMDAVDPALVDRVEQTLLATPGVHGVGHTRLRWIGHQLRAECEVAVDGRLTVAEGHEIAERCSHALLHALPRLTTAIVHADPDHAGDSEAHRLTEHHRSPGA